MINYQAINLVAAEIIVGTIQVSARWIPSFIYMNIIRSLYGIVKVSSNIVTEESKHP